MDDWRLRAEAAEVNLRFPQFRIVNLKSGELAWQGYLTTRFRNRYEVLIVYPFGYPYIAPKTYPLSGVRADSPHRFKDGSICTHLPSEWSPNMTALTAIGWAAAWLHAYDTWRKTGIWPGREA